LKTWSDGVRVTAADLNDQIRDAMLALLNPPQAMVHCTSAVPLTSTTTYTPTAWHAAPVDTDAMWSDAAPTRLTINTAGYYLIQAKYVWGNYPNGYRGLWLRVNAGGNPANGTLLDGDLVQPVPATSTTVRMVTARLLAVGDHLELFSYQTSTATQNSTFGLTGPTLAVAWTGVSGVL
jgi:hypothetical protein